MDRVPLPSVSLVLLNAVVAYLKFEITFFFKIAVGVPVFAGRLISLFNVTRRGNDYDRQVSESNYIKRELLL